MVRHRGNACTDHQRAGIDEVGMAAEQSSPAWPDPLIQIVISVSGRFDDQYSLRGGEPEKVQHRVVCLHWMSGEVLDLD